MMRKISQELACESISINHFINFKILEARRNFCLTIIGITPDPEIKSRFGHGSPDVSSLFLTY